MHAFLVFCYRLCKLALYCKCISRCAIRLIVANRPIYFSVGRTHALNYAGEYCAVEGGLHYAGALPTRGVILKSVRRRTATELARKTTQEPPLMLGPVYRYLHWDGSYETYHAFFAHLWCKLDNINISGLEFRIGDLIVGSDEERALTRVPVNSSHGQLVTESTRHAVDSSQRGGQLVTSKSQQTSKPYYRISN